MNPVEEFTRRLEGTKNEPTLIFERRYATAPADLWDALTSPERLSGWFGTFTDPAPSAVGDTFTVDLGGEPEDDIGRGRVLECDKPKRLAYRWQWQNESPSQVSADLEPVGQETLLRLTHAQVEPRNVIGYSGGWEQILLALDDELTGTATYAPYIQSHEEAAHKIWQKIIG
ncbi:SRPBCC domain-containing protein [Nesterenkonia ebinurensis]|uniref:SRPBCC domain-containing protein n=1 Tax=Nesterenkonia ebinurensis TaxID=2608252 RepID=UPI00123CC218|nr:SRPBCC domain-containing protein [Nesterenkonia ebinurensis]